MFRQGSFGRATRLHLLSQFGQEAVFTLNLRGEVDAHLGVLGIKMKRAKPEDILEHAGLGFMNILEHSGIDRLVVVEGHECFFNAMNFALGDDDHVEKIVEDVHQEFQLRPHEGQY